jgi:hypothetical protein
MPLLTDISNNYYFKLTTVLHADKYKNIIIHKYMSKEEKMLVKHWHSAETKPFRDFLFPKKKCYSHDNAHVTDIMCKPQAPVV